MSAFTMTIDFSKAENHLDIVKAMTEACHKLLNVTLREEWGALELDITDIRVNGKVIEVEFTPKG